MNYNVLLQYAARIPAIFFAITVTGFTKYIFAYILGDKSKKDEIFSALSPLKHFEIVGFLFYLFFEYGWGNPVEINLSHYKNKKRANLIINIMPIIANFAMAFVFWIILHKLKDIPYILTIILLNFPMLCAKTAVVNILPVYPFCGWEILTTALPPDKSWAVISYKSIIQVIFIFLLFAGILTRVLNGIVILFLGWCNLAVI